MPACLIGMEACVGTHRAAYEDHGTIGTSLHGQATSAAENEARPARDRPGAILGN
jgi:hypothetical protein